MSQPLNQLSESIAVLVAEAAPGLTAIRIGANRYVTGFLWRSDLIVTTDQALPAAATYTIVLSTGALISGQPGARDPSHNLASVRLDVPVPASSPEPARIATIGALVLALGANFDGSPTVRLTTIHGFPRSPGGGSAAAITLDLAGERVSPGGMVLDAEGRLLGMTSASPSGDAVVVPH
ncbi:MAG TPA: serine protease, partial [Acetobacteraceae bacterium]|nr:serine protease [Acetobacteraceae bacterium]